jgi:putative membrane protein
MSILIQWLLSALVIIVAAMLVPGVETTLVGAFLAAVVIALLSVFIKPILVILTLPINILTLGLFSLVINTVLVLLAAAIVSGFNVANFWWGLLFSVVLSLLNVLFGLQGAWRGKS